MLSERQQKIIRLLQQHQNGMTGEELSKRIGVSSRTIRTDVKNTSSTIESKGARIHSDTRSGYTLEIFDTNSFRKLTDQMPGIYIGSMDNRVAFILQKFLQGALENKPLTQQQLANDLFISLSTLKNSLKEAGKKLAVYDLEFRTYKTQGMQISGNEAKLRYFLAEYCSDRKETNTIAKEDFYRHLFKAIDLDAVEKIILRVITAYEIRLTDMAVQNLLIHIAIAMKRANQENYMVYTVSQTKIMEKTKEFEVAASIFEEIYREMSIDVATSEVYYLTQHLMTSKKYMDVDDAALDRTIEMVKKILIVINENVSIDFSKDEVLIQWLALHLKTSIPRMRFQMNIRNDVLEVIKSEYPLAFQIAVIASHYLENQENITVNENEIGYIAVHFGAALSRMDIKNDACVKRVLLVCATGIGTAVLLRTCLEENFKSRIKIVDTIPGYQLEQRIIDDVDMVITTVPIKHIQSDKIILIQHLLNQNELHMLQQKFFSTQMNAGTEIETFFHKDYFNTGLQFKTKEEILEFLTEQLKSKNLMNDEAKASVFEREEASPTEIGNLVAIPHPIYNDPPVSSIAVLILDKPIMWDEHHVQIVFLISIAKSQFKLWETIFLKLFKYLVQDNGVKEILHDATYEAFIKNFQKQFS